VGKNERKSLVKGTKKTKKGGESNENHPRRKGGNQRTKEGRTRTAKGEKGKRKREKNNWKGPREKREKTPPFKKHWGNKRELSRKEGARKGNVEKKENRGAPVWSD